MSAAAEKVEPQTALISVEEINAPALFGEGKTDAILAYIREQVADIVPNLDTAKGRQEIASAAYSVARSKTLLDDAGKNYAADLKAKVKAIDANRRKIRDALDALRDEIRKPLTEWEEAEKKREQEITGRINRIMQAPQNAGSDSESIAAALADVKATVVDEETFGDKAGQAALAKDGAISTLERALASAKQREADAAELERLREEREERDKREAAERAEQEAAERARRQAEADAQARVDAAEKQAREAQDRADRAEREAAERAENDRREREAEAQRQRDEEERRRLDEKHRTNTINEATDAIVKWIDIDRGRAGDIVALIAHDRIPHISIKF